MLNAMSKGLTRIFLDWDRPLLEQAAEWLMAQTGESDLLDLGELLAVVPTRNAARRLREMLANLAAERGTAVIPPLCGPPTLLANPEVGAAKIGRPLASAAEVLLSWISVLRSIEVEGFAHVFPIKPGIRDFSWAQGMAGDLIEVRLILGEAGLLMADVARRLPAEHEEKQRWMELGRIEEEYLTMLRELDRCDPVAARAQAAEQASLPESTKRVVVMGTADPFPLARTALECLVGQGVEVTVVVFAPEERAEGFDEWGQPLAEYWTSANAPIEIDDFRSAVSVLANPDKMHERVVETVKDCSAAEETLAIGALDTASAPILERTLRDHGIAGFSPEGRVMRTEGVVYFLELLRDFVVTARPEVAAALVRTPEVSDWLTTKIEGWRQAQALRGIDDGLAGHLIDDVAQLAKFLIRDADEAENGDRPSEFKAVRCRIAAAALEELAGLRRRLVKGELSEVLPEVLREILSCRSALVDLDTAKPGSMEIMMENSLATAGPMLLEHLAALSRAVAVSKTGATAAPIDLSAAEQMTLAITLLGRTRLGADRPAEAMELQGWLELLWEDAPHLVVAGLNDGIAPEAVVGHPFLPESLRSLDVLGLKGNAQRFARDAYQLMALVESRRDGGRVDVLLVRCNQAGDPMRPSRLLLCCQDDDLPGRVRHLFADVESTGTAAAWEPGFQLLPNAPLPGGGDGDGDHEEAAKFLQPRPFEKLSVTGFGRYLRSPFHFYLDARLGAKEVESARGELSPMEFGNFCHAVLEAFGRDESVRGAEDSAVIENYLMQTAEKLGKQMYGKSPALAVRVQLRAARQRLRAVARVQARERQEGWEICDAELDLKDVGSLEIDGIAVTGRIDRVERRDGMTRVLDYKTSDTAKSPRQAHYLGVSARTEYEFLPSYARFLLTNSKGRSSEKRWTDLQLPLYLLALREKYGESIEAGYLSMPKAVSGTKVETLPTDDELLAAAMVCAEGVVADVRAGKFWPVVPQGEWDRYHGMHLGVPERTIDGRWIGDDVEAEGGAS